ncbi:tripartite tricarboxylate transporter TctB family protein [Halohasta litorea]|uniref:Tripartite tricarboxylate transporter TctB family protein n=1 Tax=Halohasta litorea TaxID=869891 RepID=A0ABD6DA30_9EURY|nr:tripartite tricarboxylate transporter TctB family protein [Halohasta litorea]MEA1930672.1 tripartite tricarboxylate transporter TctB family protein [Euryarchaeota archaeon]
MTSTEAEEGATNRPARSTSAVALFRLAFPLAGLLLAVLYVENTYGRIRLENLYYPYFVIGVLAVLSLTVFATELRGLADYSGELSFVESVRDALGEWNRSIGFSLVAIGYIWLIEPIGFFIATAIAMVGVMLVGGRRDPLWISISTVIILVFVYVMFVQIMGLRPPSGPLGL